MARPVQMLSGSTRLLNVRQLPGFVVRSLLVPSVALSLHSFEPKLGNPHGSRSLIEGGMLGLPGLSLARLRPPTAPGQPLSVWHAAPLLSGLDSKSPGPWVPIWVP